MGETQLLTESLLQNSLLNYIVNIVMRWLTQELFFGGGSTNSVEDRGQREWGSGDVAP
jgi:hypothetical protein